MQTPSLTRVLAFAACLTLNPFLHAEDAKHPKPASPSAGASLNAPSRVSDTSWRNEDATIIVDFFNTGSWHERYHKKLVRGSWKIVSDKEVLVNISDGRTFHYILSRDGLTLTRNDGVKYVPNKEK